jgi:hypothetical protein
MKLTRRSQDERLDPLSQFCQLNRFCLLKDIIDFND